MLIRSLCKSGRRASTWQARADRLLPRSGLDDHGVHVARAEGEVADARNDGVMMMIMVMVVVVMMMVKVVVVVFVVVVMMMLMMTMVVMTRRRNSW